MDPVKAKLDALIRAVRDLGGTTHAVDIHYPPDDVVAWARQHGAEWHCYYPAKASTDGWYTITLGSFKVHLHECAEPVQEAA